jgi:hypothetical protein
MGVFVGFSRIFLLGILILKGFTARRLYKSFGVKLLKCYIWIVGMFVWCWNLDTSESRSEIPGKFWNVHEKGGEYQLGRSCEKGEVLRRVKE